MSESLNITDSKLDARDDRFGAAPYVVTVFLSAALVFLVQPMFAKMATPLLGGSPNVWNVSLVCFQGALLLGYAYAHALNHFVKSVKTQVGIHALVLIVGGLVLPFQLTQILGAPDPSQPTLWLMGVFALSIAPPFAVISATAPLVQSWYSHSGRADAADPYHLYGASNIGSLLGLAAYPFLLEPMTSLAIQTQTWTLGYVVLAALLIISGVLASKGPGRVDMPSYESALSTGRTKNARWKQRLGWVVLAFVPSSLLVGVTTHIATDVASAPFLWAPPLMLYIGTFIIVFAKKPPITLETSIHYLPFTVAAAFLALPTISGIPLILSFVLHLAALFFASLVGHGLLAEQRPEAKRLTEFYLLMSLGGVLGGGFNALLVPLIFNGVTEYPLMLVAILLIRPNSRWMGQGRTRVWAIASVCAVLIAYGLRALTMETAHVAAYGALLGICVLAILLGREARLTPVIAACCAWAVGGIASPMSGGVSERGFFGVVKVIERGEHRIMMHGTTIHGTQYLSGADVLRPTTYYAPEAPIGQMFSQHDAAGRVGVVGLGTGSVACYARPDQEYVYYEIDPLVAKFAADPAYFSYLSSCTPDAPIILGDGRLTLAQEPEGGFELLLLDAFSSDSVPAHLLTQQAVSLYLSRLSDKGILVMHVSNKHMQLETVVARIADTLGAHALYQFYSGDNTADKRRSQPSQVVILAKSREALAKFDGDTRWQPLSGDGKRPWSDDYSNVIGAIWAKKTKKISCKYGVYKYLKFKSLFLLCNSI